jgi:hypothetical protein
MARLNLSSRIRRRPDCNHLIRPVLVIFHERGWRFRPANNQGIDGTMNHTHKDTRYDTTNYKSNPAPAKQKTLMSHFSSGKNRNINKDEKETYKKLVKPPLGVGPKT